jgi:5-methylcytosine-specific restriction endonuclease McrA
VLARDGGYCQIKLPRCKVLATTVDHIVDWRDGGALYELTNLRAACRSCNTAQRNMRVAERARRAREDGQGRTQRRAW